MPKQKTRQPVRTTAYLPPVSRGGYTQQTPALQPVAPRSQQLDAICRTASALFSVPFASASVLDEICEWFADDKTSSVHRMPCFGAMSSLTMDDAADEAVVVPDARCDSRYATHPIVTGEPGLRFYARVALSRDDGHGWATLSIGDTAPRFNFSANQICQMRDLASLVEAQMQLRLTDQLRSDSEYRYRLLADNISEIIIQSDLDLRRRYVSPSVTAILGYRPAELVGADPFVIIHPEDASDAADLIAEVRAGRAERALTTLRYLHRNGHWVYLEVSFGLTYDPATRSADGFVAILRDVSIRMAAEEAWRNSETRYRTLSDVLPQMVLTTAPDGATTYCNQSFRTYYGPIGSDAADRESRVHPDDLERMRAARGSRGFADLDVRIRRHDNVYRWQRIAAVPLMKDGVPSGMLGTALDIDDIVASRKEQERTSDLLRLAQAAACAGVWECDSETGVVTLSPASARLHGLSVAPETESPVVLSMEQWRARVLPEDVAAFNEVIARTDPSAAKSVSVEFRTHAPDLPRGFRWVQSFGRADPGEAGEPQRFVGLHLDITARREAEEALRTGEARLRLSEERLALALDSGDDGLFDIDLEKDSCWVSPRWLSRLGYSAELPRQPPEFWNEAVHPDDRRHFFDALHAHLQGETTSIEDEHRLRRADGSYLWVLLRGKVTRDASEGRPVRLVGTLIDISDRKEAELRMTYMAEHDALTDLPNRYVFRRHLDCAVQSASSSADRHAVLVCDLDGFKAVNDTLGNTIGDRLLCVAGEHIRAAAPDGAMVARLGGDEFALLLERVTDEAVVRSSCERIISAFAEPMPLDNCAVDIGISIGAAILSHDDLDPEEVFRRAGIALSQAKAAGRSTHCLYEAESHARITERSLLALDMREAIRRGDFFLVYQPVVDVVSNTIVNFEALMRWRHPERGMIPPAEFIPVAEETGMIAQLGSWALVEACREAAGWAGSVPVAVNVSTVQFRRGLEQAVTDALGSAALNPNRLRIEVTESALMRDPETAVALLKRLQAMGVNVSLDDFGTGYSSLSYLRRFPFDRIKIDRSFIRDIADVDAAAIVRAIVGIGARLGMGIVAEGVETVEQLELVRREGCTEIQGYLFSKPLPAEEARLLISRNVERGPVQNAFAALGLEARRHNAPCPADVMI